MRRWLWLLAGLLVLGLLASACTGGGGDSASDGGEEPSTVEKVSPTPAPTEEPALSSDGIGLPPEALGVVQGFLPSFGRTGAAQPLFDLAADGATGFPELMQGGPLEALLLSSEDVPAGYQKLFAGSLGFDASFEDPSLGEVTMAMAMFADEGERHGIISMLMQAEDEALLQEGLAEIDETDFAEIEEAFEAFSLFGIVVTNLRQVDASGLGDGGFGFGFTMDFSELAAELGEAFEEEAEADFTAMDLEMVMFVDGSVAGVVMTFAMDDAALASLPLAEILAAKVAAAAL